ncbi:hypothetical protein LRB92_18675, partial [Atlantibacter hermannii]|nr:hypothetical protein [Atlantibacter hermannii]
VQWKGSVRSGYVHLCGFSDGERVRGARRRAPDTPGSRPAKSPLRALLGPSMGLAPSGPPQAAFKFAPGKFVLGSISSLQVGRDTASCLSRPQPRIPAGLTWLVNYASAILMPDSTPLTLSFLFFTEQPLSLRVLF